MFGNGLDNDHISLLLFWQPIYFDDLGIIIEPVHEIWWSLQDEFIIFENIMLYINLEY